jgi:hypothetical protein
MTYNISMLTLLFGKVTLTRILVILLPGLLAGVLLFWLHPTPTPLLWITALITVDLVSGMISNQLVDTNQAWQEIKPIYAYGFMGIHTFIYPIILYVIEKNYVIFGMLLFILSIKLYGFIRGYFLA